MEDDRDPQERREAFQREQLRERLRHADTARQENYRRQDEREERRRQDQRGRDLTRAAERNAARKHSQDMYDLKRSDKLVDETTKAEFGLAEQQEITKREAMLQELGMRLYAKRLGLDYEHDIRTRNLDLQEYKIRSEIDTTRTVTIDDNSARNVRQEILARLRALLVGKAADHIVSEKAKQSAHAQRVAEIKAESDAEVRAIWAENEAKKDFEKFMFELHRQTDDRTTADIADMLRKMDDLA